MRTWPCAAVILAVFVALAATAAAPTAAEASFGAVPADSAAKKKRCKKGQVKVKVGKRVSCRPLKKVLPKPRAGDPRKLFTQFVFKKDWSKFRNRRGKRPPSLPRLIRKVGRGAPTLLTRATSRGLSRLDAMAGEAVPLAPPTASPPGAEAGPARRSGSSSALTAPHWGST